MGSFVGRILRAEARRKYEEKTLQIVLGPARPLEGKPPHQLEEAGLRRVEEPDLTSCAGIYFLCSETGQVLYIGQSNNVLRRIMDHRREGRKIFHHASYLPFAETDLLIKESHFILKYNPPLNGGRRNPSFTSIKSVDGRARELIYDLNRDLRMATGYKPGGYVLDGRCQELLDLMSGRSW